MGELPPGESPLLSSRSFELTSVHRNGHGTRWNAESARRVYHLLAQAIATRPSPSAYLSAETEARSLSPVVLVPPDSTSHTFSGRPVLCFCSRGR